MKGFGCLIIRNVEYFNSDFEKVHGNIEIDDGKISALSPADGVSDFEDCVVLPGFVDVHIHGCCKRDATDGKSDSVAMMSEWLVTKGVTSFCPTTMTVSKQLIRDSFSYVADTMGKEKGAYIHGINMEGPFINPEKKGAQAEEHILAPDVDFFNELNAVCPVKIADIAPEVDGALDFIAKVKDTCAVSAAHTAADYEQTKAGIDKGINHATHLYNAMITLTSREAGTVGALLENENVMCELICDGIHICPTTLTLTFKILGEDRAVVISDAIMASGLDDGSYTLGGQDVFVTNGAARLASGNLAGSTTNLFDEFKNLVSFGIPLRQALKACTINPAKSIGADSVTGSIEIGKNADLLVLNSEMTEIVAVFVKGKKLV